MTTLSENHKLNELLSGFLVQMPLLGWIRDTESRYLYVNKQHEDFSGMEDEQYMGKSVYDLFPRQQADKYKQNDQRMLRTGKREEYIEQRNNRYYQIFVFPLLIDDEVSAIGGIELEVTEQKVKEKELHGEKEFLQALLDNLPHSIYFKDRETRFTRINKTQANLIGVTTSDEAIGRTDFDYFSEKHAMITDKEERNLIKTGIPIIDKLEKVRTLTGKLVWVSSTKVPIYNAAGEIDGLAGISIDVTEKRNAEINLEHALMKAEEADRLKSAFLANMSHDIRTPMNGILGFADLLKNSAINKKQQEKYINHIIKSGSTLLSLIDDIIDISKIEAGQLKIVKNPVNVNEVLNEIFELFENERIVNKHSFNFEIYKGLADDQAVIRTDAVRLNQILGNLISNAFKFTPEGTIQVGYTQNNRVLEFYVKDTGVGIPEEFKEVIFDRFGQVEDTFKINKKGTGLGLAITSNLVGYLGGQIRLESKPGEGSTFYFTLPYETIEDKVEETREMYPAESLVTWKDAVILIAEDEDLNYMYLVSALKSTGVTIVRAKNGKEAIALAAQRDDIQLILMDIKMPHINGYDATRAIKQIHPELPIIAQTAFVSEEDKTKCFDAGCDYFLSKPIKKESLIDVIGGYLAER
ncbi:MAG: PAS domain-containing protein [Bacteroidetes bacterium]|jgi:PAS domain S-box-containing protein|nr:PAS domain-containing protein [Bacteroidota bacterium]